MATTLRGFINDLEQVVQKTRANQAASLGSGSCPNMEQYHRSCGRMEGMEQTVKIAREMLGQMEASVDKGDLPEMPPIVAGSNGNG